MNRRDFIKNTIAVAALGTVAKLGANAELLYNPIFDSWKQENAF